MTKEDLKELVSDIEDAEAFVTASINSNHGASVYLHGKGDNLLALICALIDSLSEKFEMSSAELLLTISRIIYDGKEEMADDSKEST